MRKSCASLPVPRHLEYPEAPVVEVWPLLLRLAGDGRERETQRARE